MENIQTDRCIQVQIIGDGNCLFRSLAYFLYNDQEKHRSVRLTIVTNVIENWPIYESFICGDESYGEKIVDSGSYRLHMSGNGVYGGEVELQSFVNIYNVHVLVYVRNCETPREFGRNSHNKLILLLSGVIDKGHYDIIKCLNSTFWDNYELEGRVRDDKNRNLKETVRSMEKDQDQEDKKTLSTCGVRSPADRRRGYRMRKRLNASVTIGNTLVTQHSDSLTSNEKTSVESTCITDSVARDSALPSAYRRKSRISSEKFQQNSGKSIVSMNCHDPALPSTSNAKTPAQRMLEYRKRRKSHISRQKLQHTSVENVKSGDPVVPSIFNVKTPAVRMVEYRKRRKSHMSREKLQHTSAENVKSGDPVVPSILNAKTPAERMLEYRKRRKSHMSREKLQQTSVRNNVKFGNSAIPSTSNVKTPAERMIEYRKRRQSHMSREKFQHTSVETNVTVISSDPMASSTSNAQTPAQRMVQYRKRRKIGKSGPLEDTVLVGLSTSDPTVPSTSGMKPPAQRMREYRKRKRDNIFPSREPVSKIQLTVVEIARRTALSETVIEYDVDSSESEEKNYVLPEAVKKIYHSRIVDRFGSVCQSCDRMWFNSDLKPVNESVRNFSEERLSQRISAACSHCKSYLEKLEIPPMATVNGFRYPPIPDNLPPMNAMLERMVSPRLPFMQIKNLQRPLLGQFGSVGSIINVPVNVNNMVRAIPRLLSDDHVVNIHLKRKLIHKSTYMSGLVTRCDLLKWCMFLIEQPLYKKHHVQLNEDALLGVPLTLEDLRHDRRCKNSNTQVSKKSVLADSNVEADEIPETIRDFELDEPLHEDHSDYHTEQSHQQTTMMWNEDMALAIAPAQHERPAGLAFDEDAEELSFPGIYLGEKRTFLNRKLPKPFEIANSEIRRSDRRGVRPDHLLYIMMKVLRLRMSESLTTAFKRTTNDSHKPITAAQLLDKRFISEFTEKNLAFTKSMNTMPAYMEERKRDVHAMLRQLGKPTFFITLTAAEVMWPDLLQDLARILRGETLSLDEAQALPAHIKYALVRDDPVTCAVWFKRKLDIMMNMMTLKTIGVFGSNTVMDYFYRIEFQQRGSPHAHMMVWCDGAPTLNASDTEIAAFVDSYVSCNENHDYVSTRQIHRHTFTCYKKKNNTHRNKKCRFNIPFWPMVDTKVMRPLPKILPTADDSIISERKRLKKLSDVLYDQLVDGQHETLEMLMDSSGCTGLEEYELAIRSTLKRPIVMQRRNIKNVYVNNYNPALLQMMASNNDIQYILEEYACAAYIVDYINKANRGMSLLHRKFRDLLKGKTSGTETESEENVAPRIDLSSRKLMASYSNNLLKVVEISAQEAAWSLLRFPITRGSRNCVFVCTMLPHQRIRAHRAIVDLKELEDDNTDLWRKNIFDKYATRPTNMESVTLAQFAAGYEPIPRIEPPQYRKRRLNKILRYRGYRQCDEYDQHLRELVTLHYPWRDENSEILDNNHWLQIHRENMKQINKARLEFEFRLDLEQVMEEQKVWYEEEDLQPNEESIFNPVRKTKNELGYDPEEIFDNISIGNVVPEFDPDFLQHNTMIRLLKRKTSMTNEKFMCQMRMTNFKQRALLYEIIYRKFTNETSPLRIFLTGPAGSGKSFTIHMLAEIYEKLYPCTEENAVTVIVCASTGKAAFNIYGVTVHSAFKLSIHNFNNALCGQARQEIVNAYRHTKAVIMDEVSMISHRTLTMVDQRLRQAKGTPDQSFGGIDVVLCGDLHQLPPVQDLPIYRSRDTFGPLLWLEFQQFQLTEVMRQSDVVFSTILTKIGNGNCLSDEEKSLIQSRFIVTSNPITVKTTRIPNNAIRVFSTNKLVDSYNTHRLQEAPILFTAIDTLDGDVSIDAGNIMLRAVRCRSTTENQGLPTTLRLKKDTPYMLTSNIDTSDGLVNGAFGILKEYEMTDELDVLGTPIPKRLWVQFDSTLIGADARRKTRVYAFEREYPKSWVPIQRKRIKIMSTSSKQGGVIRDQFPIVPSAAITVHKSQGSSFDEVAYHYTEKDSRQLTYVALSRSRTLNGLYITSPTPTFFLADGRKADTNLQNELARAAKNQYITIAERLLANSSKFTIMYHNVQSLPAHINDITADPVYMNCDVLAMSEIWLKELNKKLQKAPLIENYIQYSLCAGSTEPSGGTVIYAKNNDFISKIETLENKRLKSNNIDLSQTLFHTKDSFIIVVASTYCRVGTNVHEICNTLENSLNMDVVRNRSNNCTDNSMYILCGDFNIDMRSDNGGYLIDYLWRTLELRLISKLNHNTTKYGTVIDAIFCYEPLNVNIERYASYWSYHCPIYLSITCDTNEK